MRLMILAGSLLLALAAQATAGTIYRWVDADGVTHFSAQPPQGQQAQSLRLAVQPPPPSTPATQPTEDNAGAREQQDIERKIKREVADQEAERKRYCTALRTQLAQLENNPRVRVEEAGQVRRLGEEERQARIAETRKKLAEECK
jgi:molecular chaperone DnaK (HSP70)